MITLPLSGRNVLNVIAQTPGVTGTGLVSDRAGSNDIFNAVNSPSVTANGQRGSSNGFYVDDTSVNDNPDEGGAKLSPNPDSVQEVRVSVNNYSAQYGRNSSVLTQIVTKSGTNGLHGSLFEYHTNNKLTARNEFQNAPNPITGRILPVFRRNEFGGSVGFPIRKDHTFVFGSWDELKSSQATASLQTVETPQFTDFMKTNYPNTIATTLLTSYPGQVAPNGPARTVADVMKSSGLGACTGTNALGMPCNLPLLQTGVLSASAPRNGRQYNGRVDQVFGNGLDRLYLNFYRMTVISNSINVRPAFTTLPPAETDFANLNYTHTFSPTFINVAAFGLHGTTGSRPSITPASRASASAASADSAPDGDRQASYRTISTGATWRPSIAGHTRSKRVSTSIATRTMLRLPAPRCVRASASPTSSISRKTSPFPKTTSILTRATAARPSRITASDRPLSDSFSRTTGKCA